MALAAGREKTEEPGKTRPTCDHSSLPLALTLHGHLDDQECALGEDNHAPSLGDGEDGSQHAEHSIDVRPCDRDGRQQGVQVVRYVEGVRKFLDLNKCSERRDDAEGEDDDLCSGVDPEHLALVLRTILHHEEDDEDDDAADKAEKSKEKTLAGALAIHTKVSPPLLSAWLLQTTMRGGTTLGTNLVDFLPLHLLDLVIANTSPHDVRDCGSD